MGAIRKSGSKPLNYEYKITEYNKLNKHILPIFDKYLLLTNKYFYYDRFKFACKLLEKTNLTEDDLNNLEDYLCKKQPEDYKSPAWYIPEVKDSNDAKKVISKAWLIGFIEAKGNFILRNSSEDKIVHGFEISNVFGGIVLYAITRILGIKSKDKYSSSINTTNSRSIQNIIKYFNGTLKGVNSFNYQVWARSYKNHKGDFDKLKKIELKPLIAPFKQIIIYSCLGFYLNKMLY